MIIVAIPARLASTRLPRKLLLNDTGHPLIWHTIQRALESGAPSVLVLTEDQEIYDVVQGFGLARVEAVLTEPAASGTERIASFVRGRNFGDDQIIVNFQGDEPELPGHYVNTLASWVSNHIYSVATMASPATKQEADSPSVVKVVTNVRSDAMYFSRCPIPYGGPWLKHIGLYAYRCGFLKGLSSSQCYLFENEVLEQLAWLYSGQRIKVVIDEVHSVGIDTAVEYEHFIQRYLNQ